MTDQKIRTNEQLQSYLKESLAAPPLAQIARHTDSLDNDSRKTMGILLQSYDQFIGMLSGKERDVLEGKEGNVKCRDELKKQCRAIGDKIQSCLEQIFYKDSLFRGSFEKYAVF